MNVLQLTDEDGINCNNGYIGILKFVLEHTKTLDNIKEYMIHTVYGRN